MMTRGRAQHEKKGLFQTPGAKMVECQKVPWGELTRLHKRAYHGRGTGKGSWEAQWKKKP